MSDTAAEAETAETARFEPRRHMIRAQGGKPYLPVAARLVWFRQDHPDWGIQTEAVQIDTDQKFAIFRASIFDESGRLMATATKMEDIRGFGDRLEKAETGSVGRALLLCGYGTANAPELDEGDRLADAPMHPAQEPQRRSPGPGPGMPPRPQNGGGYQQR